MRSFSKWFITLCATPAGVVILAALDSTIFFSLPFGIDAAVIILAARLKGLWWTAPLLATLGSVGGAALTFWMGVKIGEKGLDRYVPPRRLKKIRARIRDSGAIALAVLDLIPPPFPFTAVIMTASSLQYSRKKLLWLVFAGRLLRFTLIAILAIYFGQRLLALAESRAVEYFVYALIAIAVVAAFWPRVLAWPLAFICTWLGIAWGAKAVALKRRAQRQAAEAMPPAAKVSAAGSKES